MFSLCSKSCLTCACIVPTTTFYSSANGQKFDGIYTFADNETSILNCKTTNCIYLLQCDTCGSQYVGETVQDLKERMSQHRRSTIPGKDSGNFRIKQHYASSGGRCCSFRIYIVQKLAGSGRTDVLRDNSDKFKIDTCITAKRKDLEDGWVQKLHSQYPYGCNDRIDSLQNKAIYNCQYAKFISSKFQRKRSWSKSSSPNNICVSDIVDDLLVFVNTDFDCSMISSIKRLLFPLKRNVLVQVRDQYLDTIYLDINLKHTILYKLVHFVIIDLLTYKIKPYTDQISKVKPSSKSMQIFRVEFVNKAIDMINLPRLFRDSSLKSHVNFCNIKIPSVVYSSRPNISKNIFNYNTTVNDFVRLEDVECLCDKYADFINKDCDHVATGDISFFKTPKLVNILKNGPGFREPVTLDFKSAYKAILLNLDSFIASWSNKEHIALGCFSGWKHRLIELLTEEVNNLELRYQVKRKVTSVFSDSDVKTELQHIRKYFVICPIDKATKNIAIICKRYYLKTILGECMNNTQSYCNVLNMGIDDICNTQKEFLVNKLKVDTSVSKDELPHIILFPKFHKPTFSQRFVVSYSSCLIKPLAKRITLGLKAIYKQICSYSNMIYKVTGINRNWIINNNTPILECTRELSINSRASNINTYDFTTLYTNLEHKNIKLALESVIKLGFKQSRAKYISIYENSFAWVNKPRKDTFYFDVNTLMEALIFLMDNCYFTLGPLIFRQVIGVPIGVDPGPYIANLTLWYYENAYLEKLYKTDYVSAKKLGNTFRLIDDITTINSDSVFQDHFGQIYPDSLKLNKENTGSLEAHVLDLNIKITSNGNFDVSLYDKREDFPFNIIQFMPANSNVASSTVYGVFSSQLIRYFRICNNFTSFQTRVMGLVNSFISLGYCKRLIRAKFLQIYKRYLFKEKFDQANELITLFD